MEQPGLRKTYKYKLIPTSAQEGALDEVLWRCRTLYNAALEQRIFLWKQRGVTLSRYQQEAALKDLRADLPEYAAIHAHVLQDVLARLDRTYQAFFRRVQSGQKAGFPRFQGRNRWHSFTFKEYGNGARFDNGMLVLSKMGRLAVRWSRPLEGTPKTVTISREADGWYVCVSCADVPVHPLPPTGRAVGIDVGLKAFLVTSDGDVVENPRHHRHKAALALVCANDMIYLEDLRVANLVRNRRLAKSISDAGWTQFRTILDAKAAWAGREVLAVPAQYTSQRCSGCGELVPKSLSVRTHVCTECGLVMDRDENAAVNIQRAGQALRGVPAVAGAVNRESAGF